MAYFDPQRSPDRSFLNAVAALPAYVADAWRARASQKALRRLSDRELDDIGLSRGTIGTFIGRE